MRLVARLLAGIGLHSVSVAGPMAVLAGRLWAADHVAEAEVGRSGTGLVFTLRNLLKGEPAGLPSGRGHLLPVEGAHGVGAGDRALVLLQGPRAVAVFPLDRRGRIAVPDEGTVAMADVERMLRQPPFDVRSCGAVTRRGEYLLCTEILHAGTRSQGRRGRLFRNGVEVRGERKGQVAESEGVRFVYLGEERPHLWSVSGWDLETNPRPPGK